MISSFVNCLMDHLHNNNIFAIIHSQGHVMCRGQCQTRKIRQFRTLNSAFKMFQII